MSKHNSERTATQANPPAEPPAAETAPSAGPEPLPVPTPPAPLSEADIEALKTKAEQAQQWYDQLLRTTADLDNYRKRAVRERQEALKYAQEGLLQKLVPVLDNFDMAIAASADAQNATVAALQAGVAMIHQQLKAALTDAGLEEIDATRKPFDPNIHEAVAQEESSEVAEGHVLRQLRKGYKLRERLLRPATVVVAKPVAKPEEGSRKSES
jgi:molecular chaperone GrpE